MIKGINKKLLSFCLYSVLFLSLTQSVFADSVELGVEEIKEPLSGAEEVLPIEQSATSYAGYALSGAIGAAATFGLVELFHVRSLSKENDKNKGLIAKHKKEISLLQKKLEGLDERTDLDFQAKIKKIKELSDQIASEQQKVETLENAHQVAISKARGIHLKKLKELKEAHQKALDESRKNQAKSLAAKEKGLKLVKDHLVLYEKRARQLQKQYEEQEEKYSVLLREKVLASDLLRAEKANLKKEKKELKKMRTQLRVEKGEREEAILRLDKKEREYEELKQKYIARKDVLENAGNEWEEEKRKLVAQQKKQLARIQKKLKEKDEKIKRYEDGVEVDQEILDNALAEQHRLEGEVCELQEELAEIEGSGLQERIYEVEGILRDAGHAMKKYSQIKRLFNL